MSVAYCGRKPMKLFKCVVMLVDLGMRKVTQVA